MFHKQWGLVGKPGRFNAALTYHFPHLRLFQEIQLGLVVHHNTESLHTTTSRRPGACLSFHSQPEMIIQLPGARGQEAPLTLESLD